MSNGMHVVIIVLWLANVACVGFNVAAMYNSTSAGYIGFLAAVTLLNVNAVFSLTRLVEQYF